MIKVKKKEAKRKKNSKKDFLFSCSVVEKGQEPVEPPVGGARIFARPFSNDSFVLLC